MMSSKSQPTQIIGGYLGNVCDGLRLKSHKNLLLPEFVITSIPETFPAYSGNQLIVSRRNTPECPFAIVKSSTINLFSVYYIHELVPAVDCRNWHDALTFDVLVKCEHPAREKMACADHICPK